MSRGDSDAPLNLEAMPVAISLLKYRADTHISCTSDMLREKSFTALFKAPPMHPENPARHFDHLPTFLRRLVKEITS